MGQKWKRKFREGQEDIDKIVLRTKIHQNTVDYLNLILKKQLIALLYIWKE